MSGAGARGLRGHITIATTMTKAIEPKNPNTTPHPLVGFNSGRGTRGCRRPAREPVRLRPADSARTTLEFRFDVLVGALTTAVG